MFVFSKSEVSSTLTKWENPLSCYKTYNLHLSLLCMGGEGDLSLGVNRGRGIWALVWMEGGGSEPGCEWREGIWAWVCMEWRGCEPGCEWRGGLSLSVHWGREIWAWVWIEGGGSEPGCAWREGSEPGCAWREGSESWCVWREGGKDLSLGVNRGREWSEPGCVWREGGIWAWVRMEGGSGLNLGMCGEVEGSEPGCAWREGGRDLSLGVNGERGSEPGCVWREVRFKFCHTILLSSLPPKMFRSRQSLLIARWVHERILTSTFCWNLGSKEMIWKTCYEFRTRVCVERGRDPSLGVRGGREGSLISSDTLGPGAVIIPIRHSALLRHYLHLCCKPRLVSVRNSLSKTTNTEQSSSQMGQHE